MSGTVPDSAATIDLAGLTRLRESDALRAEACAKINLTADGWWGQATTRALQTFFQFTSAIDGIVTSQNIAHRAANPGLTSGWQWVGAPKGSVLIQNLQWWVYMGAKSSLDGLIGPKTIRALQAYLGRTQDGVLSGPSGTIKEMQRRLNNGTF